MDRFKSFKGTFDLERRKKRLSELEAKSLDPNLWEDQERARAIMQELGDLKSEIEEVEALEEDLQIARELADEKETLKLEERFSKLELKAYLSGTYDGKPAILSIHAGQGGTEAMDWASMLLRMYMRFFEKKGWDATTLEENPGEEAGIKSATLLVRSAYAYGYLKHEAGTHRLVRQSPFNADKLRQTSFASVEVLPEIEEVDYPDIEIKEEDLNWQFFRSAGAGGQNVNKVSTAVRLIHKPSGITVSSQTARTQEQNRKSALSLLRSKLWALGEEKRQEEKKKIAGDYSPATWGTQIRNYVLHPYRMVKDLRTGVETSDTDSVLDGGIDEFVEAGLKL